MPRAKPSKPTRKMRQNALAALNEVVTSNDSPPYAKTRAAAALLGADKADRDSDALIERDPNAPKRYVILPDNGRQSNVRYGLYDDDQSVIIVPPGYPYEVQPESFYAHVPKPPPDPRIAMRNRPQTLALMGPDEDDGE